MAASGARPPALTRGMANVGQHPMASMSSASEGFAGAMPGPPVGTGTAAQGRPNWFVNGGGGAPRAGFMGAVGKPPSSSVGPPAAAAMAASPDEPLEVMGFMSNGRATYSKIARKLTHPLMETSQKYQFLMTRREGHAPVLRRSNKESRRYTQLNVPALNYFLAMDERMPASPEDVRNVEDVLNEWHFEGLVVTEDGERSLREDSKVGMERMFTCVVRGNGYAFNAFGTDVRTGTRLFMIVKKRHITEHPGFKPKPWSDEVIGPTANNRTPMPFQFEFYGNWRYSTPPEADLEYFDEFGFRHRGGVIYLGTAANNSKVAPNFRETGNASQDLATILSMPQFFMFVDQA